MVAIMLARDVDDPDLLEVVERTVEPFAPEEHAATAPVGAATQVNHQPFRREGQEQIPATKLDGSGTAVPVKPTSANRQFPELLL